MLSAKLILKNARSGMIKVAPVGFSWSVLLFGFLVPAARKDWLWVFIMLALEILTFGTAAIILAFIYNKIYARRLFKKGYTFFSLHGNIDRQTLREYLAYQKQEFDKAFVSETN